MRKRLARGSLAPLCGGVGICISLGRSDATGTTRGWQLAESTHCFGWSRLQKPNTQISSPVLGRTATSRAGKQPLEGRSCCDFPSWALQLCSPTPRETLPKRGMASSGTEAAACPPGHIRVSLFVRARAPWPQPRLRCSQEFPGHGRGCGYAPGASACLVLHP